MKVTKCKIKDRQLHNEGSPQRVSAEQKGYVEASVCKRITSQGQHTNTCFQTQELLEQILDRNNLNGAYNRVRTNKGAGGIDKMDVTGLLPYLREHREELLQQLRRGTYKPNPVRRVEIPKETKGEYRKLGVPTVVDRVFQQAIAQVLMPLYEPQFSQTSYGFRPKRSAHDALNKCIEYIRDGYEYVVDMDLKTFFDTVNHSKLIEVLSRTIKDGRVISLIHKYLNAGVMNHGIFEETRVGVPQGGPLSPLLSNIMLNELDKELEKRGHKFVRYADDCIIFCKTKKSAVRTLANITPFIEEKLFLTVNRQKTKVHYFRNMKYLGYAFYRLGGEANLCVHKKSLEKCKNKIREILKRNNGMSNEKRAEKLKRFIQGWVQYFKLANLVGKAKSLDEWIRRKIRTIYWKQWKRIRTRYRILRSFGVPEWKVHELANCRKGPWRVAKILNSVLTKERIAGLGYISMTDYYKKVCVN